MTITRAMKRKNMDGGEEEVEVQAPVNVSGRRSSRTAGSAKENGSIRKSVSDNKKRRASGGAGRKNRKKKKVVAADDETKTEEDMTPDVEEEVEEVNEQQDGNVNAVEEEIGIDANGEDFKKEDAVAAVAEDLKNVSGGKEEFVQTNVLSSEDISVPEHCSAEEENKAGEVVITGQPEEEQAERTTQPEEEKAEQKEELEKEKSEQKDQPAEEKAEQKEQPAEEKAEQKEQPAEEIAEEIAEQTEKPAETEQAAEVDVTNIEGKVEEAIEEITKEELVREENLASGQSVELAKGEIPLTQNVPLEGSPAENEEEKNLLSADQEKIQNTFMEGPNCNNAGATRN